jgi:tRNA (guanosine-2'-O-)-methyltransferase
MTPERRQKMEKVLRHRQPDLAVVLEEVQDPHNIYAVMRSADAVGVKDVYVIHQGPSLRWPQGRRSSASAFKWLEIHHYQHLDACMEMVADKYDHILGAHLAEGATDLYELDFTRSLALVFGNEHKGLSEHMRTHVEAYFRVPMVGMIPSLNISVACAVTLYEAFRQRRLSGYYSQPKLANAEIEHTIHQWNKNK